MELFQLRYFVAAARRLNFTQAAVQCHIAQPSLSAQIAALEKELGTSLFHRQGRSVRLTDAGEALLGYAERLIALEEEARLGVRRVVGLEAGKLSLWTLPTPSQHLLPPLLARFRTAHPGISISVHEAVPARAIAESVLAGRADLGVVHLPCALDGLNQRILLTEELALIVPEAHPLAGTTPTLASLSGESWVWVPEGQSPEHPIFAACLAAGFTPRIACVSGSAGGMQALVAAGLGIALLPRLALSPPPGTVIIELAEPRPTRTLALVWRSDEALSHAAMAFMALL
ncbi:LysR substrate-binding domain-containing protein [Armatimonas sp.]|uniref:LysR family transcriptional regulator n=1 Tax=Armatimonas sp. TaxID=1872638 RepID=UPI00286B8FC5|nr:LysR substrate-binding domain-containing protein [Armatimonas sp.]